MEHYDIVTVNEAMCVILRYNSSIYLVSISIKFSSILTTVKTIVVANKISLTTNLFKSYFIIRSLKSP